MRKNTEDRAISKVFSYFDEKVPFGVIMSQNWHIWPKIRVFCDFVPLGAPYKKIMIDTIDKLADADLFLFSEFPYDPHSK